MLMQLMAARLNNWRSFVNDFLSYSNEALVVIHKKIIISHALMINRTQQNKIRKIGNVARKNSTFIVPTDLCTCLSSKEEREHYVPSPST